MLADTSFLGAHSGDYAAMFGAFGSISDSISQTVSTTVGAHYVLDFWLKHEDSDTANSFTVSVNGTPEFAVVDANAFDWTEYSYSFLGTSPSTTVTFAGRDSPSVYLLDDVSLVDPPSGPAPSTWVGVLGLAGMGLLALVWRCRRCAA